MGSVATRVLLVEGDEEDSLLTISMLEEADPDGFSIHRVSTYDEAVTAIESHVHDVHLIDCQLGVHTGLDLVRLAAGGACPSPSIILTDQGDPEVDEAAMKAGAADYLVKGRFDAEILVRSIRYALERAQVEHRIQQRAAVIDGVNQILLWGLTCPSDEELALRSLEVARSLAGSEYAFMGEANASGRVDVIALAEADGIGSPMVLQNVELSGAWRDVLSEERGVITNAPLGFPAGVGGVETGMRLKSFLGVPLREGARTVGFLGLANKCGGYSETDRQHADALAAAIAEGRHRKRADAALRESQRLQRTVLVNIPDPVWFNDMSHRFLMANEAMASLFACSVEQVVGKTFFDLSPRHAAELTREDDEVIRTGRLLRVEHAITNPMGELRWFDVVRSLACNEQGEPIGTVGIARDVTDRKRAEMALRVKEAELLVSQRLAMLGNWQWSLGSDVVSWSEEIYRITGRDSKEPPPPGAEHQPLFTSESWARLGTAVADSLREGVPFALDLQVRQAAGASRWIVLRAKTDRDASGAIVRLYGTAQDITERKQAEEKSLRQLARTQLLNELAQAMASRDNLESIYQVVVERLVIDLPADISAILKLDTLADTLVVLVERSRGLLSSDSQGLVRGGSLPITQTPFRPCQDGSLVQVGDCSLEESPLARQMARQGVRSLVAAPMIVEGKVMGLLVVGWAAADASSVGDSLFLQQLSEHVGLAAHHAGLYGELREAYEDLRQTRKAIMQQERLRALGQMASGIAHDINNALSPVVCYAELLLDKDSDTTALQRTYLEAIRVAGLDISKLVGRMREFYRARDDQDLLQPLDLNSLVEQTIELTRPRWSTIPMGKGISIHLHTDLQLGLPVVLGSEAEVREALTNLIFNGTDAMREGGSLTLRTQQAAMERTVILEIIDSGSGMDDKTLQHCLEPFYTTKGEGGTGLGLAMVYGIMQRHEGSVEIESQVGQGTVVRLVFPVRAELEEALSKTAGIAPEEAVASILCVDDDPILRTLLSAMLTADGHAVTLADGGQAGIEAFRAARRSGAPFDIVVTDLGMPDVSGRDVVRDIRSQSPATPMILLTGWGTRMGSEQTSGIQVDAIVSKPPKLAELRQAIQTARNRKPMTVGKGR